MSAHFGDEQGGDGDGVSRRELLTRAAIAGGVVWSAPLLTSLPAFAAGTAGTLAPCSSFFAVRIDRGTCQPLFPPRDSGNVDQGPGPGNGTADVCPALVQWADDHPDVTLGFPGDGKCPQLTSAQTHLAWAVLLPPGPIPDASAPCRLVLGFGRAGDTCCAGFVDPSPPDPKEKGRRVVFPQCADHGEISRVEMIYCCP